MSNLLKERWLRLAGIDPSESQKWGVLSETIQTFTSSTGTNTAGAELGFGSVLKADGSVVKSSEAIVPKAAELALAYAIQEKYKTSLHDSVAGHTFVTNTSVNATASTGGQISASFSPKGSGTHTAVGAVQTGNVIGFRTAPGSYSVSEQDAFLSMAKTIENALPGEDLFGTEVIVNILYPTHDNAHTDVILLTVEQAIFGNIEDIISRMSTVEELANSMPGMKVYEFHMKYKNTGGRLGSITSGNLAEVCLDASLGAGVGIHTALAGAFAGGLLEAFSKAHRGPEHASDAGKVPKLGKSGVQGQSGGVPNMQSRARKGWEDEFKSNTRTRKEFTPDPSEPTVNVGGIERAQGTVSDVTVSKPKNQHHREAIGTDADFKAAFTAAKAKIAQYFASRFKHDSFIVDMDFKSGRHTCKVERIDSQEMALINSGDYSVTLSDYNYDLTKKDSSVNVEVTIALKADPSKTEVPFVINCRPSRGTVEINKAATAEHSRGGNTDSYEGGSIKGGLKDITQSSTFNSKIGQMKGHAKLKDMIARDPNQLVSLNDLKNAMGEEEAKEFFKMYSLMERYTIRRQRRRKSLKSFLLNEKKTQKDLARRRNQIQGREWANYDEIPSYSDWKENPDQFSGDVELQSFFAEMEGLDSNNDGVVSRAEEEQAQVDAEKLRAQALRADDSTADNSLEFEFQGEWVAGIDPDEKLPMMDLMKKHKIKSLIEGAGRNRKVLLKRKYSLGTYLK